MTSNPADDRPSEIEVAQALAHPIRAAALRLLETRTASPKEIAVELDAPLGTVSYHVRELLGLGCVELVGTTPRRGAIEHHYRATVRARLLIEPL